MSFLGFEIAKSGMNSSRYHMNVTNHNIANVNTPGYSRQLAIQSAKSPIHSIGVVDSTNRGVLGTGSEITSIERIRNDFIDGEYRSYLSSLNYNHFMAQGYDSIEKLLNEPSETGISAHMSDFWNSLSELSSKPSDMSARTAFVQSGLSFTTLLNSMGDKIDKLSSQYSQEVTSITDKVNGLTKQIYDLNEKIKDMELTKNPANDLRDQRDNMIDELSKIVDIQTYTDESGGTSILAGGRLLVGMDSHREITVQKNEKTNELEVLWSDEKQPFNLKGGHLQAVLEVSNKTLKEVEGNLDTMIQAMANRFNDVHKAGFDMNGNPGLDFFVSADGGPLTIHNITINPKIVENESLLALSSDPTVDGDNGNLKDLMKIKDETLIHHPTGKQMKIDEFYNHTVSKVGTVASSHRQSYTNSKNALDLLAKERASISSVSLDEETANLLQYQHAFNASAKALKVVDEMLSTLIELA